MRCRNPYTEAKHEWASEILPLGINLEWQSFVPVKDIDYNFFWFGIKSSLWGNIFGINRIRLVFI